MTDISIRKAGQVMTITLDRPPENAIDEDAVEKAMQRAQEALRDAKDSKLDPAEIERLESVVRFSVAQLGIKRRRR